MAANEEDLAERVKQLEAEVQHWKSNHDHMVERCAILRERHDLPVDRIPAYQRLIALQEKLKASGVSI